MGETIIGIVGALVGVLVGGRSTATRERAAWRRDQAMTASDEVADVCSKVYADDPASGDFSIRLRKLLPRLRHLGVRAETVDAFDVAARACRKNSYETWRGESFLNDDGDPVGAIESKLVKLLDEAAAAVDNELHPSRWAPPWRRH